MKYRVHFTGAKGSQVIESDYCKITESGVLMFPTTSSVGWVAYSPARWLEVEEITDES